MWSGIVMHVIEMSNTVLTSKEFGFPLWSNIIIIDIYFRLVGTQKTGPVDLFHSLIK